jgi:hypothetical protein
MTFPGCPQTLGYKESLMAFQVTRDVSVERDAGGLVIGLQHLTKPFSNEAPILTFKGIDLRCTFLVKGFSS